jgi:hypothetical protein
MAPKSRPKPARFLFTVGMVLAMALTILTITADRDLAARSAIYHPPVEAVHQGRHCRGHIGCGLFKSVMPDGFAVSSNNICRIPRAKNQALATTASPTGLSVAFPVSSSAILQPRNSCSFTRLLHSRGGFRHRREVPPFRHNCAMSSLRAMATMAIRRVRPAKMPRRLRNHSASSLPGW